MEFWMRYITILDKNSKLLSVLTSKRAEAEDLARFSLSLVLKCFPTGGLQIMGTKNMLTLQKLAVSALSLDY